jgi:hypothetical protein
MEGSVFSETFLSLISEVRMLCCPWCGRHLKKWYGKHIDELSRPELKVTVQGIDASEEEF